MGIDTIPVPPIRDLSNPQQVGRLVAHLHATQGALQRLADDTEVPTAPTLITVRQGAGKTVEIEATFTEPASWTTTELYRNTTNNSATATKIQSKRGNIFHDVNVSYGTTYYYWAKVVASAATSDFSPVGSITVATVATTDVADSAVTVAASYSVDGSEDVGSTEEEIGTVTITTNGGFVEIIGKCNMEVLVTSLLTVRIRKDSLTGTILDIAEATLTTVGDKLSLTLVGYDSSPAASQIYKLTGQTGVGGGNRITYRRLLAINYKK